ncbi:MAG TPA: hypothetical protein VFN03_01085 [Trueperaceae bacterium]|nr:hypothetical protein [Trueperaceae bacterium]
MTSFLDRGHARRAATRVVFALMVWALQVAAAQPDATIMQGVAVISEGARVSLRWSLPDDAFPAGGFVVTRSVAGAAAGAASVSWDVPSPLPPSASRVSAETYEAATVIYSPEAAAEHGDEFALLRGLFTLQVAIDPDLAFTLGILVHDEDVVIGRRYDYEVRTAGGARVGTASITAGSTPPLPAPTGLRATPNQAGVELIWDRGAESGLVFAYRIRASVDGGESVDLTENWFAPPAPPEGGPEVPHFLVDEGRTRGQSVGYSVVGRDLFGRETPPSAEVSVLIPDPQPLPQALVIDGVSDDLDVTLTWALERDPRVAAVAVYRSSSLDVAPVIVSPLLAPSTTGWTDTGAPIGLVGGTDYYYAVAALDATGAGTLSPIWAQRVVNPHGPDPATDLRIEPTETALLLSWTAPPQRDVGHYQVYAGRPGTPLASMTLIGETTLTSFAAPVPANTLFDVAYRVRAVNTSDVAGAASQEIAGRVLDLTPPSAPLWAEAVGVENAVELTWLRDLDPDVAHLRLMRSEDGGAPVVLAERLEPAVTHFLDDDVVAGVSYSYALVAVDASGNESEPSADLRAAAWGFTAPGAVTGLRAVAEEDGVRLTWDAAAGTVSFVVTKLLGGTWVEISDLIDEPGFRDTRGHAGDSYRVVSYSAAGQPGGEAETEAVAR